jgi:hypothetical protein
VTLKFSQSKSQNRCAPLENSNDKVVISRGWEGVKEKIKTSVKEILGYYKLKWQQPCFDG